MSHRHSRSKSSSFNEEDDDEANECRIFSQSQREELENPERALRNGQQLPPCSRTNSGRALGTPQSRNASHFPICEVVSHPNDKDCSIDQPLGSSVNPSRRATSVCPSLEIACTSDAFDEEPPILKPSIAAPRQSGRLPTAPQNQREISRGQQSVTRPVANASGQIPSSQSRNFMFPTEERPPSSVGSRQPPSSVGNRQPPTNRGFLENVVDSEQTDYEDNLPSQKPFNVVASSARQVPRSPSPYNARLKSDVPSISHPGSRATSPFNDRTLTSSKRRSLSPETLNVNFIEPPFFSSKGPSPHYSQVALYPEERASRSRRTSPGSNHPEFTGSISQQGGISPAPTYAASRQPSAYAPNSKNISFVGSSMAEDIRPISANQSLGARSSPSAYASNSNNINCIGSSMAEEIGPISANRSFGSRSSPPFEELDENEIGVESKVPSSIIFEPGSKPQLSTGREGMEGSIRSSQKSLPQASVCPQSCGRSTQINVPPCQPSEQNRLPPCSSISASYNQSCGGNLDGYSYPKYQVKDSSPGAPVFCLGRGKSPPLTRPRYVPTLSEYAAEPYEPEMSDYIESKKIEGIKMTRQHLCQLSTPKKGKPCVREDNEEDIFSICNKTPTAQNRGLPKKPELTKEELDSLIRCETQDVTSAWYLTSDEKKTYKKPCPKQQKAQMSIKNIVHSHMHYPSTSQACAKEWTSLIEPDPEDISPDVAASMMFSQEQGYKLEDCPEKTIKHLFPEDKGFQFRDKIPPSNVSIVTKRDDQEDIIEKSASVPSEGVSDSAYTRTMKQRGSDDMGSRLSYDIDFALGQGKREYVLVAQKPQRYNKIQFRGNLPNWFPGFFSAFPDEHSGTLKVVSSPSKLFEKAWQLTNPKNMPASDITVLE